MRGFFLLACTALLACSKPDPSPGTTPPASSGALALVATGAACAPDAFDTILKKYVTGGKVDYGRLKSTKPDVDAFDAYLGRVATCDATKLQGLAHYAFWVNAYNAFNIKGVLDQWPVADIKSVEGFLDKKKWRVANLDATLNDMEYKQLIPAHQDARAHFVVVCADLGSVPLAPHAYTPENLEAMLEKKTREFVADPHNLTVDTAAKRVSVSMLFSPEWYEKDFLADKRFKGKKAVEYLVPYVDKPTGDFLARGDYTVTYIAWDWSLNAATATK
jgi:hypothetical protein